MSNYRKSEKREEKNYFTFCACRLENFKFSSVAVIVIFSSYKNINNNKNFSHIFTQKKKINKKEKKVDDDERRSSNTIL